METTIRKRIEVQGFGMVEGEFIQNEDGWFCREVNGIPWDFREWGAPAPMDTPEDAAVAFGGSVFSLARFAARDYESIGGDVSALVSATRSGASATRKSTQAGNP